MIKIKAKKSIQQLIGSSICLSLLDWLFIHNTILTTRLKSTSCRCVMTISWFKCALLAIETFFVKWAWLTATTAWAEIEFLQLAWHFIFSRSLGRLCHGRCRLSLGGGKGASVHVGDIQVWSRKSFERSDRPCIHVWRSVNPWAACASVERWLCEWMQKLFVTAKAFDSLSLHRRHQCLHRHRVRRLFLLGSGWRGEKFPLSLLLILELRSSKKLKMDSQWRCWSNGVRAFVYKNLLWGNLQVLLIDFLFKLIRVLWTFYFDFHELVEAKSEKTLLVCLSKSCWPGGIYLLHVLVWKFCSLRDFALIDIIRSRSISDTEFVLLSL